MLRTSSSVVGAFTCLTVSVLATLSAVTPCRSDTEIGQPDGHTMTTVETHKHTNHLIHATSPYLLQHAHNPVNWFEWGEKAFAKARAEDKPVFLSIGYSACHWCHVMEHESFEDEEVAAVLNENFVSIKVDREERPDIDEIYMAYTQAATGGGGWPMSVWLAPDGTPFHAGTYFPRERFMKILGSIADTWKNDRENLVGNAEQVRGFFARWSAGGDPADGVIPLKVADRAAVRFARGFDRSLGGMSGSRGNKFPPSMTMELMLRAYRRTGNEDLLEAVKVTLDQMARGGIYDHLGGGICRYSTDPQWLVPHFEKMLYDQALVSSIYLDAYQATKDPLYAYIAADILDYVIADLQSDEGGFYSTRDADSDGLEGAYYIWTVDQVREVLGEKEARLFCSYYDVSETGNWFERRGHAPQGPKNILHISKPPQVFAKQHGLTVEDLNGKIRQWRGRMLAVRARRTPPGLDDKILTAWNGLIIASLAKGSAVLDKPEYARSAARAADFVLSKLRKDERLLRSYRNGQAHLQGYLSDYAFLIEGMLNLYEATFDQKWLNEALALNETLIKYYHDPENGAFFFTASDSEVLLARSKNPHDGAIPSGNSVEAMNLLRLAVLFDRKDYRKLAEGSFRALAASAERSFGAHERLLCAVDFYHDTVKEIAIIGDPASDSTRKLLRQVFDGYLPNKVVVHATKGGDQTAMPLLRGKTLFKGQPAAYVCENYACKLPVTTPTDLAGILAK